LIRFLEKIDFKGGFMLQIVIEKGRSGKWFWKLKARNGETLAHSEVYSSRAKAFKTAEMVAGPDKISVILKEKPCRKN
jgi:uncharacterized protein YegP (UPF0339 family)